LYIPPPVQANLPDSRCPSSTASRQISDTLSGCFSSSGDQGWGESIAGAVVFSFVTWRFRASLQRTTLGRYSECWRVWLALERVSQVASATRDWDSKAPAEPCFGRMGTDTM